MNEKIRKVETLAAAPLFADLSEIELENLALIANFRNDPEGAQIFQFGTAAEALYVINSGTVALRFPIPVRDTSQSVTIDEKATGSVISWSALVPPHHLTMSAESATDVELLELNRTKLQNLLEGRSELNLKIMKNLARVIGDRVALLEALLLRNLQRQMSSG